MPGLQSEIANRMTSVRKQPLNPSGTAGATKVPTVGIFKPNTLASDSHIAAEGR